MRLTKFTIKNFKGIKQTTLNLMRPGQSDVCTLVGLNESGKTSVLEAIHWLDQPGEYNDNNIIPIANKGNFNDTISVEAEAALTDESRRRLMEFLEKGKKLKDVKINDDGFKVRTSKKYKKSVVVEHENRVWSLDISATTRQGKIHHPISPKNKSNKTALYGDIQRFIANELEPYVVHYDNFLFDFPEKIYIKVTKTKTNARGQVVPEEVKGFRFYKQIVQDVLNSVHPNETIESLLTERYEKGGSSNLRNIKAVLSDMSRKITETVVSQWKKIFQGEEESRFTATLEISLGSQIETDETGWYLTLKVRERMKTFEVKERSLGFRWFLGFALLTHFRAHRQGSGEKSLFLLDEPASNLHPAAQTRLLSAFTELPTKQPLIFSTHSKYMIEPKWLAGAFVVVNEGQSESDSVGIMSSSQDTEITANPYFRYAAQHPNQKDLYRPILDALEDVPSSLDYVPELVILEGKNDFHALPFVQRNCDGLIKESRRLNLHPSVGKDQVDYPVNLYLAWGSNFIVLLDDDRGGKSTKKRLFGNHDERLMQTRVFTLADVNPNWKGRTMEDLFSEKERVRITQHLFPEQKEYDKAKFNISLLDHLVNNKKVTLNQPTVKNFERLFTFIEAKLESNRDAYPNT